MDGLDLSHCICDGDASLVKSNDPWCERNGDRATASRRQACTAIVTLGEVAPHKIAREVHGRRVRIAGIVEERNRQRSTTLSLRLISKIQPSTWRHSQWARWVGS